VDALEGRVGRVYMPKQDVNSIALRKMKGLKRERQATAVAAKAAKKKHRNAAAEV
jgi:ribosome production factor 2